MFWDQGAYNDSRLDAQCLDLFNVTAAPDWAVREYGGFRGADAASNIVFSNGELDPWITGARSTTYFLVCLHVKQEVPEGYLRALLLPAIAPRTCVVVIRHVHLL